MRQFVKLIQKQLQQNGSIPDPLTASSQRRPLSSPSPSHINSDRLKQLLDIYKQVDTRGSGSIKWKDFSSYIMHLDVMQNAASAPSSSLSAAAAAADLNDDSDNNANGGVMYHYQPDLIDKSTYTAEGILKLQYFESPIDKLALLQYEDEGVQLLVPPEYPTDMFRTALSLSHHTSYKQHKMLNAICVNNEDSVITSSVMDGKSTSIGGYISVWDIPTAEERAAGSQFLATMLQRIETEFPQHFLLWSGREELLFSAGKNSGVLMCTRVHRASDEEEDEEESEDGANNQPSLLKDRVGLVTPFKFVEEDINEFKEDHSVLRSDPPVLKEVLQLKIKMKVHEIEYKAKVEKRSRENKISAWLTHAEGQKSKKSTKESQAATGPMQVKIRVHTCAISGILEIRSPDGSNFLLISSTDGSMTIMDLAKPYMEIGEKALVRRINAHESGLVHMVYSELFDVLFTAGTYVSKESTPDVFVWDSMAGQGIQSFSKARLKGHEAQVCGIECVDEDSNVITVDELGWVRIFSLVSFSCIQKIPSPSGQLGPVRGFASLPPRPGKKIPRTLVVARDKLHVYHRKILNVHDPLLCSFYNAAFHTFLTVSPYRINVWDASKGVLMRVFSAENIFGEMAVGKGQEITSCCLDGSGRKIIVGDESGSINVMNYLSGKVVKQLDPHSGTCTYVGYSPTDKCVISTGMDGTLHMADDADSEGFVLPKKAGTKGRSVVLRTIEINANHNSASSNLPGSSAVRNTVHIFSSKDHNDTTPTNQGGRRESKQHGFPPNTASAGLGLSIDTHTARRESKAIAAHSGNTPVGALAAATSSSRRGSQAGISRRSSTTSNHSMNSGKSDEHEEKEAKASPSDIFGPHCERPRKGHAASHSPHHAPSTSPSSGGRHGAQGSPSHNNDNNTTTTTTTNTNNNFAALAALEELSQRMQPMGGGNHSGNNNQIAAIEAHKMGRRSSLSAKGNPSSRKLSFLQSHELGRDDVGQANMLKADFSPHLNLIATFTTTGAGEHHCHVWDYETCALVGTCVHPKARSGESFEVNSLKFLSKPFLIGAFTTGLIHVWAVPNCICNLSLLPSCTLPPASWEDEKAASRQQHQGGAATITSMCVLETAPLPSDPRGEDPVNTVFASDEKGNVYCWRLTTDVLAGKACPSRRRSTFNPHRMVHVVVGGDELTHFRRIARSLQAKSSRIRTPCNSWRAHDEMIQSVRGIVHPPSIITAGVDCTAKIWSTSGALLGRLDMNEPGGVPSTWAFKPAVARAVENKQTSNVVVEKGEDFQDLLENPNLNNIMDMKVASSKSLNRHPSQERFLERQLMQSGGDEKEWDDDGATGHHTTWVRSEASVDNYLDGETTPRQSHWDSMMDSLHIFETALSGHTKMRMEEAEMREENRHVHGERKIQSGKHWKLAPAPETLDDRKKTIPRQYLLTRPMTTDMGKTRTRSGESGGGGGGGAFAAAVGARPMTAGGGGMGGAGAGAGAGAKRAGLLRPTTSEGFGQETSVVSTHMKLRHMGFI